LADVAVHDHGSIVILVPLTDAAGDFFDERLPDDCPMWGAGYAVERRYAADILEGLNEEGLEFEVS
jgi:hypothetical protein